jgi:hypothetical protein
MNAQFYDPSSISTKTVNLACIEVKDCHTGKNIKEWMFQQFEDFEISSDQVCVMSVDSAANITKAINDIIEQLNAKSFEAIQEQAEGSDDLHTDSEFDCAPIDLDEFDLDQDFEDNDLKECFKDSSALVNCTVHKLQLAVNKFLWALPEIKQIGDSSIELASKLRTPIVRLLLDAENEKQAKQQQPLVGKQLIYCL